MALRTRGFRREQAALAAYEGNPALRTGPTREGALAERVGQVTLAIRETTYIADQLCADILTALRAGLPEGHDAGGNPVEG